MSLNFTIRAIDGISKKQFDDMLAVEDYFGEALRYSNVSLDGVQRIHPGDEEAEMALLAYREASELGPVELSDMAIAIPLSDEDKAFLARELRMSKNVDLGNGRFLLRNSIKEKVVEDLVALQLITEPATQCRENTVVYHDYKTGVVVVEDLLGEAKEITELTNRPLVDVPMAVLHYVPRINEDTGKPVSYPSFEGLCAGPKNIVVKTIQRSLSNAGRLFDYAYDYGLDFASKQITGDEIYLPFNSLFQAVENMHEFCQDYKRNCNGALEGAQLINETRKQLKDIFNIEITGEQVQLLLQDHDHEEVKSELLNQMTQAELSKPAIAVTPATEINNNDHGVRIKIKR